MTIREKHSRLTAVFAIAFLAFNFPILALFGKGTLLWGIPVLYLYLFAAWLALILLTAWLVHKPAKRLY